MPTPAFFRNYGQVIGAAHMCLDKDLHMPALVLVFTLIDSFAWAISKKAKKATRETFEAWAQSLVIPNGQLSCTATELYAARCGVLHTLTSKADLHSVKGVRQVVYSWGPTKLDTLQKSIAVVNSEGFVGLHINELLEAVKGAIAKTFEAAKNDSQLQSRLQDAALLHFSEMPASSLEKVLQLHSSGLTLP